MNGNLPSNLLRPDPLRWAVWLCLFAPPALAAAPLQPASGPGGTPAVSQANGVPVIAIVPPDASGLSHNQYNAYNVGSHGVVLNNAVQAGQSQLAGALAANPQFNGQAASTILNEVISRQASLIEGPQEIFGRAADYILANPNGITLNGGSFINTTRAGFLVGTPVIEDQRIRYLDTLHSEGVLNVQAGGQSNRDGALDLIAPRIEGHGPLQAARDEVLTLTVGRNRIDAGSAEVLEHLPGTPASIDANLFGAMRAGRIRVVSTAEGAGVRIGEVELVAEQTLSLSSAGDLQLTATQAKAGRIEVHAGHKLVLDSKTAEQVKKDREKWKKKAWFVTTETYQRDRTQTDRKQTGTQLHARDDIELRSDGDMQMTAARVKAGGNLQLHSENDLRVEAGVDSRRVDEQVRHRKHLWRGNSDTQQYRESANPSVLEGGTLNASAGNELQVRASELRSQGDLQLQARQVEVGEQLLSDTGSQRNYRGDLVSGTFFGGRKGNDTQGKTATGSTLRAEGQLSVSADGMRVAGSSVSSAGDAVLYSDKAALQVEAAQSTRSSQQQSSDSKLFGLLGNSSQSDSQQQQVLVSDVRSSGNLRLASADELRIKGSNVSAGQQLSVQAKGELRLDGAEAASTEQRSSQQRYFTASAGQTRAAAGGKPGSRQYEARVGYEVASQEQQTSSSRHVPSSLSGANLELRSDTRVAASGAKLDASAGDLRVAAPVVELNAGQNRQASTTQDTRSGGGLALSGGIDRLGSAFEGHRNHQQVRETTSTAQPSELSASAGLRIDTEQLASQGTQVRAGGAVQVNAANIDNRAGADTHEREQTTSNWQGSLGASLEYRDISRPIERLVEGREAARFQQAGVEDALAPPSIGADLAIDHQGRRQLDSSSKARPGSFAGASVNVDARQILDQGTAYSASSGALTIKADQHQLLVASDHQRSTLQRTDAGGALRIDTSTGEDINARIEGKYATLSDVRSSTQARPGSLAGGTGIQVQLGSDGRYEGTHIDAGSGAAKLASGGNLSISAAHDRTEQARTQLDTSLWAKGGNRPTSAGLDVRAYADHSTGQSQSSQAQVASIQAKGPVQLGSGADLSVEGARIDAGGDIAVHSEGLLKVSSAHDSHQASGSSLGGGGEVAASVGAGKGGGLGGHLSNARQSEHSKRAIGPRFTGKGELQLTSLARDDQALHVEGLQADARHIGLNAPNGGVVLQASGNTEQRDNRDITGGAGFKLNRGESAAEDARALHGRVQVSLDKADNQTWNHSNLRADSIGLQSRGDTRIEGASLEAGRITGVIDGDLHLASRMDRVDTLRLKGDLRLSQEKNPQGYINAATSLAGPLGGKVKDKAGSALGKADPGFSPTFSLDLAQVQRDGVGKQAVLKGSEGVELKVGGEAKLVGARVQSASGTVALDASAVQRETLSGTDYRREVSIDASNSPVDLGTAIAEMAKGKGAAEGDNALDLGLLRTSGHSRTEQWVSAVQGSIE